MLFLKNWKFGPHLFTTASPQADLQSFCSVLRALSWKLFQQKLCHFHLKQRVQLQGFLGMPYKGIWMMLSSSSYAAEVASAFISSFRIFHAKKLKSTRLRHMLWNSFWVRFEHRRFQKCYFRKIENLDPTCQLLLLNRQIYSHFVQFWVHYPGNFFQKSCAIFT